jgi:hypothetical protein
MIMHVLMTELCKIIFISFSLPCIQPNCLGAPSPSCFAPISGRKGGDFRNKEMLLLLVKILPRTSRVVKKLKLAKGAPNFALRQLKQVLNKVREDETFGR